MVVYLLHNRVNGKVYVGKTVQTLADRWSVHKSDARIGIPGYLQNAIRKHGPAAFEVTILATADSEEQLNNLERFYIALNLSNQREFGYNLTAGGDGVSGLIPWNKGTKGVMVAWNKGLTGVQFAWNKGKTFSAASRQKMSAAAKGRAPWNKGKFGYKRGVTNV
jgi:group I intron endonuclease